MTTSVDSSPIFFSSLSSGPVSSLRGVAPSGRARLALLDDGEQLVEHAADLAHPARLLVGAQRPVEAACARRCGTPRPRPGRRARAARRRRSRSGRSMTLLGVAGGRALVPVLLPRAAPEPRASRSRTCARTRLGVHPGEHEHLAGVVLLHDGGDETGCVVLRARFASILTSSPVSPWPAMCSLTWRTVNLP